MMFKSTLRCLMMIFTVIIFCSLGTYAQKTDCSQKTDQEIVFAVYDQIKVKYADQIPHVNVRITEGTLTVEGWINSKKAKKEVEKIAKKTACVKRVVNLLTVGKGGGCGSGQRECGGTCISEKSACNICLYDSLLPSCAKQQ